MTKKIILVLVEGQTDQDTLAVVFTRLVENQDVEFEVIRTDLTAKEEMTAKYIEVAIEKEIEKYFRRNPYLEQGDILKVVQLIDTDGAFVPASMVRQSKNRLTEYHEDFIAAKDKDRLIRRNSIQGGYRETWDFIMANRNSLKRHTNLLVFFNRLGIGDGVSCRQ